jgi:hypothetical protein
MSTHTPQDHAVTVVELLAEAVTDIPANAEARLASTTRLGDGQTNPDE